MSTVAINNALALRFPPISHALMWEVAPGDRGTHRYADAVAVGLWASHGHMIQGIEVKASRSDFQREMQQPEKSEPIMRYCHRYWLACPKGLVKPEELPPTWGMLELVGDVLRVKVKAPLLKPVPPSLAFFASLCRRRVGGDDAMFAQRVQAEAGRFAKEETDRIERNLRGRQQDLINAAEETLKRVEAIKVATGIDLTDYGVDKDVIDAIKAYRMVNGGWRGSLADLRRMHEHALAAIDNAGFFARNEKA